MGMGGGKGGTCGIGSVRVTSECRGAKFAASNQASGYYENLAARRRSVFVRACRSGAQ
jgi:hypothetical protein